MIFSGEELADVLCEKTSTDWDGVYIWGAYKKSDEVVEWLENFGGYKVVGYIDRKAPKLSEYNNVPVYTFDIFKGKKAFVFVALTRYDREIEIILSKYGYEEWKDYWYPCKEIHLDGTLNYQDKYGNRIITNNKTPIDVVVKNGGVVKIESEKLNSTLCIRSYDKSYVEIGIGNKFEDNCKIIALTGIIKIGVKNAFQYRCGFRTICKGQIYIGNMCTMGRNSDCVSSLNTKIVVEDDCMISYEVNLRAGNSHNIIDLDTFENLDNNSYRDIKIGKHVWLGMRSLLINGVEIGSGSVIGANSFIAKKVFPNNTLIAGNPARILRNHVAWIRNSDDIYTDYGSYTEAIFDERDSNS